LALSAAKIVMSGKPGAVGNELPRVPYDCAACMYSRLGNVDASSEQKKRS
jgi:hypothetical protein